MVLRCTNLELIAEDGQNLQKRESLEDLTVSIAKISSVWTGKKKV